MVGYLFHYSFLVKKSYNHKVGHFLNLSDLLIGGWCELVVV